MAAPRLSVIVPNYNHGKYLPVCLRAILSQSEPPFEVIVIDDASKDNSLEVTEEFSRKHKTLRVFRNEKNMGVVYGMNRGIELASGDYLFFSAADDEVQPGFFAESLRLLESHPNAGLSCTGTKWHDAGSGLSWQMGTEMTRSPGYVSPKQMVEIGRKGKLLIVSSSAFFRRDALIQAGKFIPELRWHCDWYATYAVAFSHGFCYTPEPLSDFYLHSASYYGKGRQGREHREVLTQLLERLTSPECADLAPRVRDSAALALFELPLLRLVLRNKRYRFFLTPLLIFRCLRRSAEVHGRRALPVPVARLALKMLYSTPKGET